MKIAFYSDAHWCAYSSIVRRRGEKYSVRLENEIKSINWVQKMASQTLCDLVVCGGDFFDKETLTAEEITALNEIEWANIPQVFLVGNHEMGINTLQYSTSHIFQMNDCEVIDKPKSFEVGDTQICYLPYILETERKPLDTYFEKSNCSKRLIFSHNDIAGMQMGPVISKIGFPIDEIEANCDKFLNGHLHNGGLVTKKIVNVGNITGQNFSENAMFYEHVMFIVDTETLRVEAYENPYAFNFYKLDFTEEKGYLWTYKDNAVLSVKLRDDQVDEYDELIKDFNIIEKRYIIVHTIVDEKDDREVKKDFSIDHLDEFKKFMIDKYGDSTLLEEELYEVSK